MTIKATKTAKLLPLVVIAAGIAGCGTVKEKTAPCKRPANMTSYAPDPRQECGPMMNINSNASEAFAAIEAIIAK
ncbi:hypothetical protein ABIA14_004506 [Sinorhizobium fredii]|uniref:hypothetical protein n=1 Tax=Rhizobium fredii TaxID=380 RepID=UPI003516B0EC